MDTSIIVSIAGVVVSALISLIISSMKIGAYKNKVDTNCTDIGDIKREQKEVRDKVIACETSLKEREPLTRKKSPVTLTSRGERVLNDSGGKKFVDDNYPELKTKVESKSPSTSYDIQETSKQVIEELKEDTRINPIKEYLFKEGMDISEILNVLGIYLRDKFLKDKGVAVADIDQHDPTKL